MRRLLAVGTLALGAAWAKPLTAQTPQPEIAVRLEYSRTTEPVLFLGQPAYIALFEMVPGRGIVQLYPLTKYEANYLVEPGYRQIIPARAEMARRVSWQSAQAVQQFTPGFHFGMPGPARQVASGPQGFLPSRHVIAIASDKPLRIGTPNETMSYLHLAMPALWSPASFEANPEDLESIIDAVLAPGAASGVSAIQLATQVYTMATYSPVAFAMYNQETGVVNDEVWATCFGLRIRAPSWVLSSGICVDAPLNGQTIAEVVRNNIGLTSVPTPAPVSVTQVAGHINVHEVPVLTPIATSPRVTNAHSAPLGDRGVSGGRDIGGGARSSRGEGVAGAPGTTGSAGPGGMSTPAGREDGTTGRTSVPQGAPVRAPAGSASRERPVP